jgi:hypothetical protein
MKLFKVLLICAVCFVSLNCYANGQGPVIGTKIFKDGSVVYLDRDTFGRYSSKVPAKVKINDGVIIVSDDLYNISNLTIYGSRNNIIFEEFQGSEFVVNGVDNTLYTSTHYMYGYYDQYHGSVRSFAKDSYSARCYKINMSSGTAKLRLDESSTKVLRREVTTYYSYGSIKHDLGTNIPDTKMYVCDIGGDSMLDIFANAYTSSTGVSG